MVLDAFLRVLYSCLNCMQQVLSGKRIFVLLLKCDRLFTLSLNIGVIPILVSEVSIPDVLPQEVIFGMYFVVTAGVGAWVQI